MQHLIQVIVSTLIDQHSHFVLQGLEPCIRPDVWPFLLEVFDSSSAFQQRQAQHQLMVRQYQQLLLQCQVRMPLSEQLVS